MFKTRFPAGNKTIYVYLTGIGLLFLLVANLLILIPLLIQAYQIKPQQLKQNPIDTTSVNEAIKYISGEVDMK